MLPKSQDEIVGIKENKFQKSEIEVSQNFPNPFSEFTTIKVNLIEISDLKLKVFRLLGQKIIERTIFNTKPGLKSFELIASDFSPGYIFMR